MKTTETGIDPSVKVLREDIDKLMEYAQNGLIEHGCVDEQAIFLGEKIKKLKAIIENQKRVLKKQEQLQVTQETDNRR